MYAKKLFFPLVVALLACLQVRGQRFPEHPELATGSNAGSVVLTHLNFGAQIPGGDLADRFGPSGSLGAGLEWLTAGNWALGLDG
ncbi:MAG: hypothetical protein JNK89_04605, partial [Saprospiraceae bacterium]|nr:hypothetical protein [Saprospiraceae bacterium]